MAKGTKRNQERAAAQAKKRARVEKRKAEAPKASTPKKKTTAPKTRPSGNQSGLTTAQIREKRELKGIGKSAGGNKNNNKGDGKGGSQDPVKNNLPKQLPNVLDQVPEGQLEKGIYQDLLGKNKPLTKKIQAYSETYNQNTNKGKDYLRALVENATQRMKINPQSYGRSKEGTSYDSLSMAEKYDSDSKRLLSSLEQPMANYFSNKNEASGLNMFDSNKELKFDSAKLKRFASSGVASTLRSKAQGLGVSSTDTNRTAKSLEGIGKVKNKKSADLKSKFAQDLKFIV